MTWDHRAALPGLDRAAQLWLRLCRSPPLNQLGNEDPFFLGRKKQRHRRLKTVSRKPAPTLLSAQDPTAPWHGRGVSSECTLLQGQLPFTPPVKKREERPSDNSINHGFTEACRHPANPKINALRRCIHQVHDSSWPKGSGKHCF